MTDRHTRALLLLGSPRRLGASAKMRGYLADRLVEAGCEVRTLSLVKLIGTEKGRAKLATEAAWAGLCLLCAPVYVDGLPGPVVRALEFLSDDRPAFVPGTRFAAVVVCGFPESENTAIALDMCRLFARRAGLEFAGGLGVGGAGAFSDKPLETQGALTLRLRQGLDQAALAFARGQAIPESAVRLAAGPHVNRRFYLFMASLGMLTQARKHRVLRKLWRTPFQKP